MPSYRNETSIDSEHLEGFLRQLSTLSDLIENRAQLVAVFGYYLAEVKGEVDVTPKKIRACYDAASIAAPVNLSDTMSKANAFVRTANGTTLTRDAKTKIKGLLIPELRAPGAAVSSQSAAFAGSSDKSRNVVVVHGRDTRLRDSMFGFLRSAGLAPVEWNEAVGRTGKGAPYTGEVVGTLFQDAQAIVVMVSPDEEVTLRRDLQSDDYADNTGWQARPNVYIEAGMAIARDEKHTILVQIGRIRQASDLLGRNSVLFDGSSEHRNNLIERLRTAGCAVKTTGSDWLRVGDFEVPAPSGKSNGGKARK